MASSRVGLYLSFSMGDTQLIGHVFLAEAGLFSELFDVVFHLDSCFSAEL